MYTANRKSNSVLTLLIIKWMVELAVVYKIMIGAGHLEIKKDMAAFEWGKLDLI